MTIQFYNEDIPDIQLDSKLTESFLNKLIELENKKVGALAFIFCSDEYLIDINRKYLNHDYYTDIITFDYCEDDIISGDIFISINRVKENAAKYEVGFFNELYRVIFHGVLHLLGFKDKSEEEKQEMRSKEDFYLELLVKD